MIWYIPLAALLLVYIFHSVSRHTVNFLIMGFFKIIRLILKGIDYVFRGLIWFFDKLDNIGRSKQTQNINVVVQNNITQIPFAPIIPHAPVPRRNNVKIVEVDEISGNHNTEMPQAIIQQYLEENPEVIVEYIEKQGLSTSKGSGLKLR